MRGALSEDKPGADVTERSRSSVSSSSERQKTCVLHSVAKTRKRGKWSTKGSEIRELYLQRKHGFAVKHGFEKFDRKPNRGSPQKKFHDSLIALEPFIPGTQRVRANTLASLFLSCFVRRTVSKQICSVLDDVSQRRAAKINDDSCPTLTGHFKSLGGVDKDIYSERYPERLVRQRLN